MRKTHIGYKLLTQHLTTHNNAQWEVGKCKKAAGEGNSPCTNGVLHYYPSAEVALFLNPIHANITNPRLFKVECSEQIGTDGLKAWCKEQKLIEEISFIAPTKNQRVAFALFVAMPTSSLSWKVWANRWLSGEDRSAAAAYGAAAYAYAAAAYGAAAYAADAAYAAAAAAYGAAAAYDTAVYAATAAAAYGAAYGAGGRIPLLLQEAASKAMSFK